MYPYPPRTPPSSSSFIASPLYPSPAGSSAQPGGITRSRTLFYLSVRDSSGPSKRRKGSVPRDQYGETVDVGDDEEERLIGGSGSESGLGKGLPPRWVDISDEVEEVLSRIKPKITALDKLHAKHVLPGFTDRTAEEREIERHTSDITRDFRKCTSLISSISPSPRAPRAEITTAKNVQRGLAQKVQEMSGMFRKKQRVYMQKLQGHAIKSKDLLVASGAISLRGPEMMDELAEDEQATSVPSLRQTQTQTQAQSQSQVQPINMDIETRTKEITQIASSISELAELFRDLGGMVVEQGTVLDSVEYNVGVTAREMEGAVEELKVAQRYQANTGRRKCILLLVLIILGLILVLIYKPRSTSSPSPPISDPSPPLTTAEALPPSSDVSDPGGGFEQPDSDEVPSETDEVGVDVADVIGRTAPWLRPPSLPPVVSAGDRERRGSGMNIRVKARRRQPGLDRVD